MFEFAFYRMKNIDSFKSYMSSKTTVKYVKYCENATHQECQGSGSLKLSLGYVFGGENMEKATILNRNAKKT